MVEKYVQVRSKLDRKIFTPYGATASLYTTDSIVYDNRGEIAPSSTWSSSEITIVDYDITTSNLNFQPFAKVNEDNRMFVCPYSVTVSEGDYCVVDSVNYKVVNVESPRLKEVIVRIVELQETNDIFY